MWLSVCVCMFFIYVFRTHIHSLENAVNLYSMGISIRKRHQSRALLLFPLLLIVIVVNRMERGYTATNSHFKYLIEQSETMVFWFDGMHFISFHFVLFVVAIACLFRATVYSLNSNSFCSLILFSRKRYNHLTIVIVIILPMEHLTRRFKQC